MPFHNKHSYLHAPRRTRSRPFDNAVAGRRDSRHDEDGLIALNAYQLLEDAWSDGVAQWCRSASAFVLGGGRAWMVTASEGQGNWIRSRLLCEGVSLFGVQFLDARSLRRELCLRLGMPPPVLGGDTLEFLLRLYALRGKGQGLEFSSVARHPGACLAALGDLAAAGWLDDSGVPGDVLSSSLNQWLPELRATGAWTPEVDRRLLARAAADAREPDAAVGLRLRLGREFLAVVRPAAGHDADGRRAPGFTRRRRAAPRRRSSSPGSMRWKERRASDFAICESSDFPSSQADLVGRLEGADLDSTAPAADAAEPELLVGVDSSDLAVLARDFVARWLAATAARRREAPRRRRGPAGDPLPVPERVGRGRRARVDGRRHRGRGRTRRNSRTLAIHPDSARDPRLPSGRRRAGIAPGADRIAQRTRRPLGRPPAA